MTDADFFASLSLGTELHHTSLLDSRNHPVRCRVSGKCKLWATRPDDFSLPVKYGLRTCFRITPASAHEWSLPE